MCVLAMTLSVYECMMVCMRVGVHVDVCTNGWFWVDRCHPAMVGKLLSYAYALHKSIVYY